MIYLKEQKKKPYKYKAVTPIKAYIFKEIILTNINFGSGRKSSATSETIEEEKCKSKKYYSKRNIFFRPVAENAVYYGICVQKCVEL